MKNSAIAGVLAASAGVFGKLGSDSNSIIANYVSRACNHSPYHPSLCIWVSWAFHFVFFVLMLATNALMMRFFIRGLHATDSLTATITSFSNNFIVTAIAGSVFFGEHITLSWISGGCLILIGVYLILMGDTESRVNRQRKSE